MRPLTAAVAAAGRGQFVLDGVVRMRERPIQDLVDGLVQLGVDAKCTLGTGCPPVAINAQGLPSGKVRRWGRLGGGQGVLGDQQPGWSEWQACYTCRRSCWQRQRALRPISNATQMHGASLRCALHRAALPRWS